LDSSGRFHCIAPSATNIYDGGYAIFNPDIEFSIDGSSPFLTFPAVGGAAASKFRYYTPPTISGIYPSVGHSEGGQTVVINGNGFAGAQGTATLTCLIGNVLGTVVSFNGTAITCITPRGAVGTVSVAVSLNGGRDYHYAPSSVQYRYTNLIPPLLQSAAFDSSGSRINLLFDRQPTDLGGRTVGIRGTCVGLLAPATIARLGGAALIQCRWPNATTLVVDLAANSWPVAPVVGDVISLVDRVIAPSLEPGCSSPGAPLCNFNSTVRLSAPAAFDLPLAVAAVPSIVSACQLDIRLDASGSTSSSVYPLSYYWELSPLSPNAERVNQWLLNASITTPYQSVIRLPLSLLLSGISLVDGDGSLTFYFSVVVYTHLRTASLPAQATAQVLADSPTIGVTAPSFATRSSTTTLSSRLLPGCGATASSLVWRWSVDPSSGVTATSLGLSSAALAKRTLLIPRDVLPISQSVVFTFTAGYRTSSITPRSASVSIYTRPQPLVAKVAGGSARSVGVLSSVLLDGSASYDPDLVPSPLLYRWECTAASPTSCGTLGAQQAQQAQYVIPGGALSPGTWYYFTLTVSKLNRTASASVNITTLQVSPPTVRLEVAAGKASAEASLRVRGSVASASADATYSYAWTARIEDGFNCTSANGRCPATTLFPALPSIVPLDRANLVVPVTSPPILSPGATYVFTLTVTDAFGLQGFAQVQTEVNRPPFGGSFAASGSEGVVLQTEFVLSASGWTDDDQDDLPLSYSFVYVSGTSALPFAPSSTFSSLTTTVPIAGAISVYAEVSDQFGSTAQTDKVTLRILWQPEGEVALDPTVLAGSIINDFMADALSLGDVASVQSVVSCTTALLAEPLYGSASNASNATNATQIAEAIAVRTQLRDELITALDDSFTASTTETDVLYSHAILVSQLTSQSSELSSTGRVQAALLVDDLVGSFYAAAETGSTSTTAQSSLFTTLSNVLDGSGLDSLDALQSVVNSAGSTTSSRRRRRLTVTQEALADTVSKAVGALAETLLVDTVDGESYVLTAAQLSMRASRTSEAGLANATFAVSPEAESAGLFVRFPEGFNGSLVNGSGVDTSLPVDVQVTNYASNPRSYDSSAATLCIPLGNGTLSSECSSGVGSVMQTVTLRQGPTVLNVTNLSQPIEIGFEYTTPAGINTSRECDGLAWDRCIAEHDALLREAFAKQQDECRVIAQDLFWNWNNASGRYDECIAVVQQLLIAASAKNESCASIPPPCNAHGTCVDGLCECDPGILGGQCEVAPNCSFWDTKLLSWSTEGCRLALSNASLPFSNPNESRTGRLVCQCDHLTDFGLFFGGIAFDPSSYSAEVFSRMLSLRFPDVNIFTDTGKFFQKLGEMSAGEWSAWIGFLLVMVVLLLIARLWDDRELYRSFMPAWHQLFACKDKPWLKAFSLVIIWFCTSHFLLQVFFVLPWEGIRHIHRLMILYNVLLAQICILMLFWDTFVGIADASTIRQFWAFTFDATTTLVVSIACRLSFSWATRAEHLSDPSAYIETDQLEPTLIRSSKHIHFRRVEKSTGWDLVFRQTAPVPWPGPDVLEMNAWDPQKENFANLEPSHLERYRDVDGMFTFRMMWSDPSDKNPKLKSWKEQNVWRQRSNPMEPSKTVDGFVPLHLTKGAERFGGLRGSKTRKYHLCQGATDYQYALFVIGQLQMNSWGGLTSWDVSAVASARRVELYVLDPKSASCARLLEHLAERKLSPDTPASDAPPLVGCSTRQRMSRAMVHRCSSRSHRKLKLPNSPAGWMRAPKFSDLPPSCQPHTAASILRPHRGKSDENKLKKSCSFHLPGVAQGAPPFGASLSRVDGLSPPPSPPVSAAAPVPVQPGTWVQSPPPAPPIVAAPPRIETSSLPRRPLPRAAPAPWPEHVAAAEPAAAPATSSRDSGDDPSASAQPTGSGTPPRAADMPSADGTPQPADAPRPDPTAPSTPPAKPQLRPREPSIPEIYAEATCSILAARAKPPPAPMQPTPSRAHADALPTPRVPKPNMETLARCKGLVPAALAARPRMAMRTIPCAAAPDAAPPVKATPPALPRPGPEEVARCTQLVEHAAALKLTPAGRLEYEQMLLGHQRVLEKEDSARFDPNGPLNLTTANLAAHTAQIAARSKVEAANGGQRLTEAMPAEPPAEEESEAAPAISSVKTPTKTRFQVMKIHIHRFVQETVDFIKYVLDAEDDDKKLALESYGSRRASFLRRRSSLDLEEKRSLISSMGLNSAERRKLAFRYQVAARRELFAKRLKNNATPHGLRQFWYKKRRETCMVQLQPHSMLIQFMPYVSVGCFVTLDEDHLRPEEDPDARPTVHYVPVNRIVRTCRWIPPRGKWPFYNGKRFEKSNISHYAAEYYVEDLGGKRLTPEMIVPHPMLVHVQLAEIYHDLTERSGLKHSAAIRQLRTICRNLPMRYQFVDVSVWKEPYNSKRNLVAWMFNLTILVLLLLTVVGYYLTRKDEINFEQFAVTFTMIAILQPFGTQMVSIVVKNVLLTLISAFCLAVCLGESPAGKEYIKAVAEQRSERRKLAADTKAERRRENEARIAAKRQERKRSHLVQLQNSGLAELSEASSMSIAPTMSFETDRPQPLLRPVYQSSLDVFHASSPAASAPPPALATSESSVCMPGMLSPAPSRLSCSSSSVSPPKMKKHSLVLAHSDDPSFQARWSGADTRRSQQDQSRASLGEASFSAQATKLGRQVMKLGRQSKGERSVAQQDLSDDEDAGVEDGDEEPPPLPETGKLATLSSSMVAIEIPDDPPSVPPGARLVLEACSDLSLEAVENLKSLITWQRSMIAKLAIKVREQEAALASIDPTYRSAMPVDLSHEAAAWAESQLALNFLSDGMTNEAQQLVQAVRTAVVEEVAIPSAPSDVVGLAGGIDPVELAEQLLAELRHLAELHQRDEWLRSRLA